MLHPIVTSVTAYYIEIIRSPMSTLSNMLGVNISKSCLHLPRDEVDLCVNEDSALFEGSIHINQLEELFTIGLTNTYIVCAGCLKWQAIFLLQ